MVKSWMERLDSKTRDNFDWLRFHRFENQTRTEELCDELIHHGKETNDPALIGSCYYYQGELNYILLNTSEAMSQIDLSLMYLEHSDAPRMYCNACNTLATIHMQSYSFETAMDYYLKALNVCEANDFWFTYGTIHGNIAAIHIALKNYQEALENIEKSWHGYSKEKEEPDFHLHALISNRTQLATTLIYLDNLSGAKHCIEEIESLMRKQKEQNWDLCNYYYLLSLYAERTKQEEDLAVNVKAYQHAYQNCLSKPDMIATSVAFLEDLYQHGHIDFVRDLKDILDELLESDTPPTLRMTLLKISWSILEDKTTERVNHITNEAFKTFDQLTSYENRTKNAAVHKLIHRSKQYKDAEKWMMIANKDTLTGLWNRRHYESLFTEMRELAINSHFPLAVGIMDIDFFKQFNDHYGHLEGDNCLKKVASILTNASSAHMQFARYGGDEFLLLCTGLSKEELEIDLLKLYKAFEETNIPHQYSATSDHVTISMGVTFHDQADQLSTSVSNLISEADKLLYQVKKNGKNNFMIQSI